MTADHQHLDAFVDDRMRRWLSDTTLTPTEAEHGLAEVLTRLPATPQARRRSLGRWFDRDGGARRRTRHHDRLPDQTHRRNPLMLSLTASIAALAVLALGVGLVSDVQPLPPGAGTGATHVVTADGSGDFATIAEAVEAAADGDTILVRPGTYIEAVIVDKDVTLKGDGERADIVIAAPDGGPEAVIFADGIESASDPYAIVLLDTSATLSDLTFRGEPSEVFASGGAPTLERLTFDGVGRAFDGSDTSANYSAINVTAGSTAILRDNELLGGGPIGVHNHSEPLIEGNSLVGGPHIWGAFGDGAIIRGNTITNPLVRGFGIFDPGSPLVEANTITGAGASAIDVVAGTPTIRGNRITGSVLAGINVEHAEPTVSANVLEDNLMGISWTGMPGSSGAIEDNTITGGAAGIVIAGGDPLVIGNTIGNSARGIELGKIYRGIAVDVATSPTLSGNTSCDNGVDVLVFRDAKPVLDDTNEFCEGITNL